MKISKLLVLGTLAALLVMVAVTPAGVGEYAVLNQDIRPLSIIPYSRLITRIHHRVQASTILSYASKRTVLKEATTQTHRNLDFTQERFDSCGILIEKSGRVIPYRKGLTHAVLW